MHTTAGATGGAEIAADYASLTRVGAGLRGLAEALSDPASLASLAATEPEIGLALEHAERDWHGQRRRLTSYLADAARGIDAAAQAYRQTDQQVAAAATGSGR